MDAELTDGERSGYSPHLPSVVHAKTPYSAFGGSQVTRPSREQLSKLLVRRGLF
jgi:hypothetical protein